MIKWVQRLGDMPPKFWEGEKNVQNSERYLTTFDFDREYFLNASTLQIRKVFYQPEPLPRLAKKNYVNFGPQTKKLYGLILTNSSGHFAGDYISAFGGCCPLKSLHALQIDQDLLAHTTSGMGVPLKNLILKI